MTVEEIEDLAMIPNAKIPDKMSQPDQVLFQKFRYLHALHRIGGISREQASKEKQRFLVDYRKQVSRERFRSKQSLHTVTMWKEMERFTCDYLKNRNLDTADRLVKTVHGQVHVYNQIEEN